MMGRVGAGPRNSCLLFVSALKRWCRTITRCVRLQSVLDLSWVYGELSPHYPALGRPSIDPISNDPDADSSAMPSACGRSVCSGREVQGQSVIAGFCGLEHRKTRFPDHSVFSASPAMSGSVTNGHFFAGSLSVWLRHVFQAGLVRW